MNDDIHDAFLRLEELAATIRGLAEASPSSLSSDSAGDRRPEGRGNRRSPVRNFGVFHSAPKAGTRTPAIPKDLEMVEAMISIRGLRDNFFEGDLFFDPAWSILIDLFRAELKGQSLSVTSVCIGSGVAVTTALRYLSELENRGYVGRTPDPQDKRRAFVHLTPSARQKLEAYFDQVNERCRAA
jgi:predicted transcriptional regulator